MRKSNASLTVKTRQLIAGEYGFCRQTLGRKLIQHGILLPKGVVNLKSQKIIYETLGYPPGISKDDYESV